MSGTGWNFIDPRDRAYVNPQGVTARLGLYDNPLYRMAGDGYTRLLSKAPSEMTEPEWRSVSAGLTVDNGVAVEHGTGEGFNLRQWFTDNQVTDPTQMSYFRYATLRGLNPNTYASVNYVNGSGTPSLNYGWGKDNFSMQPQNMAKDLNLAPNSAQYNAASVRALQNRSNRTALKGAASNTETETSNLDPQDRQKMNQQLMLARPTLLG